MFPWGERGIAFPVGVFPGRATSSISLRVKFVKHHVQDTVVILEEGSNPLLRCSKCDMLVTWRALNVRH